MMASITEDEVPLRVVIIAYDTYIHTYSLTADS